MTVDTELQAPAQSGPPERFGRVPALDGIRALAIVAVLIYHNYSYEGFKHWGGGYLGVDVFFVLSGFLITTLLLREHHGNGRIDLRQFWARRARRLLPALFVLIAIEAILAQRVLDPLSAAAIRSDGIASLFYYENWRLAFGAPTTASHTWSLAVEEQWYLIWPILLFGLLWFMRGRLRNIRWVTAVLAVASAIECALLFRTDGSRSYFGTDTRAQALLIGALLALVLLHRPQSRSRLLQVAGWCGIAFLLWAFLTLKAVPDWMYRGGFFAVAVASACVIAAAVQSQDSVLARIFSFKGFVAIGIISYGLYLYHLPIFIWLTPLSTGLDGLQLLGLRIGVTAAIAVASYFLLEKRFLRRQRSERPSMGYLVLGAVAALVLIIIATPDKLAPTPVDNIAYALKLEAVHAPKTVPRVMLVGDKSVIDLTTTTPGVYAGSAIHGAPYAMKKCDVVPGAAIDEHGNQVERPANCSRLSHNFREVMSAYRPAYGVLMLSPTDARDRVVQDRPARFRSDEQRSAINDAVDQVRQSVTLSGGQLVLLPVRCDSTSPVPADRIDWLNSVLSDYAGKHPGVIFERQAMVTCAGGASQPAWTWPEIQHLITSH
jgi:peptidoglycan/LPS O-acetylase OafA/YrhL